MTNSSTQTSANDFAEVLSLAFRGTAGFDIESTMNRLSQFMDKNKLSKKQLNTFEQFKNSEISQDEFLKANQRLIDYLKKNTDNNTQHDEANNNNSEQEENSTLLSKIFTSNWNFATHKALKDYPSVSSEAYKALEADILMVGKIHKPILVFGKYIIDGRARAEICKKYKIQPTYQEWYGSEEDLLDYLDSIHIHQKDLGKSVRAILAFENLDDFKKSDENVEGQKNKLKGIKPTKGHDSYQLAAEFYATSRGLITLAGKLEKHKELYRRVRAGQFNLSFALSLVKVAPDNKEILNFIDTYKLSLEAARSLVKIKAEDSDLYNEILYKPDKVEDYIKIFGYRKDYPEIYDKLIDESMSLEDAKKEKQKIISDKQAAKTAEESEATPSAKKAETSSVPFDIDDSLKTRISTLAQKKGKTIAEFLEELLAKVEKPSGKGK
ncbi:MAG: hypothetical protein NT007_01145 [Candidatus Kapabacteria bacterium]|nr:hypothetical protein [Candidatus Kapabacteria bacterium]